MPLQFLGHVSRKRFCDSELTFHPPSLSHQKHKTAKHSIPSINVINTENQRNAKMDQEPCRLEGRNPGPNETLTQLNVVKRVVGHVVRVLRQMEQSSGKTVPDEGGSRQVGQDSILHNLQMNKCKMFV